MLRVVGKFEKRDVYHRHRRGVRHFIFRALTRPRWVETGCDASRVYCSEGSMCLFVGRGIFYVTDDRYDTVGPLFPLANVAMYSYVREKMRSMLPLSVTTVPLPLREHILGLHARFGEARHVRGDRWEQVALAVFDPVHSSLIPLIFRPPGAAALGRGWFTRGAGQRDAAGGVVVE